MILNSPFKMATDHVADKQKQSELSDSCPSTWNVTTTKMVIQFYKENRLRENDTPKEDADPFGCKAGAIDGAKKRRRNKEKMA